MPVGSALLEHGLAHEVPPDLVFEMLLNHLQHELGARHRHFDTLDAQRAFLRASGNAPDDHRVAALLLGCGLRLCLALLVPEFIREDAETEPCSFEQLQNPGL